MKSKILISIFVLLLVSSVLNVYAADYKTNLLYFIEGGEGIFYGCGLTTDVQEKIGLKFEFMHNEIGGTAGANDINNDVGTCENKGSYYCDKLIVVPLWKSAYQYHETEKVDSLKEILENPAPEGMSEEEWSNIQDEYRIWPVKWYDSDGFFPYYNTTIYPDYPPQISKQSACCPTSFCFNGTTCENSSDYVVNPKKPPIFMTYGETGWRCSRQGTWNVASLKPDYTGNDTGYCTSEDECYAGEGRACLVSGNWSLIEDSAGNVKDRMCYNGDWTTRTKYLAAALLNYTKKNNIFEYAIYCDSADRALDEDLVVGTTNFGVRENDYFDSYFFDSQSFCGESSCSNNFCVMKYGDAGEEKVIIATSLNREINDTEYPVFRAFGFNESEDKNDKKVETYENGDEITLIYSSSKSGDLYYSRNKQVIFFTAYDAPAFEANLMDDIKYFVKNPISAITGQIFDIFYGAGQEGSVKALEKYSDFDKVYFAAKGNNWINGIQERKYNQDTKQLETAIAVQYFGFDADICGAVANMGPDSCNASNTNQTVFIRGIEEEKSQDIWQDLTSKIRLN